MTASFTEFLTAQRADGLPHLPQDAQLKTLRDAICTQSAPPTSAQSLITAGPLSIDLSAHWWTADIASLWSQAYHHVNASSAIEQLLSGAPVNVTENRPALHTALREKNPRAEVAQVKAAMKAARQKLITNPPSGQAITDIINLGVGGSDLGPCMVEKALRPFFPDAPRVHFISNVDGTPLAQTLHTLNPRTSIFIVCSKTFTTLETMKNFESVARWLRDHGFDQAAIGRHLFAATSNVDAAQSLLIDDAHIFPLWDWVGGRYSVWSAIGLSLVLAFGCEAFEQFLAGARSIDHHFASAPIASNAPAILAALDAWYGNYFHAQSLAVIPYESSLELLPSYLQQLMMESNGKSVTSKGEPVRWRTGQIIWGGVGTNTQHSFHQLLHQGTQLIPIDFLLGLNAALPLSDHHTHLAANCLAQTQALASGYRAEDSHGNRLAAYKNVAGHKPFSLFYYQRLSPEVVGAVIALYEHRVFCQALLWDILPFDQWGVELGKTISKTLTPLLENRSAPLSNLPKRLETFIKTWRNEHSFIDDE